MSDDRSAKPGSRRVLCTHDPGSVEELRDPTVDLWLWQRTISQLLGASAGPLARSAFSLNTAVELEDARPTLTDALTAAGMGERDLHLWAHELCTMVELVARLGHDRVRVRLQGGTRVKAAPRFHVDATSVRLLCTYAGPGTEWLPEHAVDRIELQRRQRSHEHTNGRIARQPRALQHTLPGWVAIIRGSSGARSRDRGLVHRSPAGTAPRLLLRIDPAGD